MEPPTERRKQAARTAAARAKLIGATIELIAERGIDSFSIAHVAERAGVSRGLPGHHFRYRDELIAAVAAQLLRPPGLPGDPGREELLASLRRSLARAQGGSAQIRAFLAFVTATQRSFPVARHVRGYTAGATKFLELHLEAARRSGDLHSSDTPATLAPIIMGLVIGQAVASLPGEGEGPSATTTETFVAFVEKGLGFVPPSKAKSKPGARRVRVARSRSPPKSDAPKQPDLFPSSADALSESD